MESPKPYLRPATLGDADLLLSWRNDPETRRNSRKTQLVSPGEHMAWLSTVLVDADRQLYVALLNGKPIGTARADRNEKGYELSWTVAPENRRQGYGKAMVSLLVAQLTGTVRAEIKEGNLASMKIARAAGLNLQYATGGITFWSNEQPDKSAGGL